MGSKDGTIYIYDPLIVTSARIQSYNSDEKMEFHKKKRPEIVKWVEPNGQ